MVCETFPWIRKFFSSVQEEVRTLFDLSFQFPQGSHLGETSVNLPQCFAFQGFPFWSAAKTRKKLFLFVGHNFKMIAHPSIRRIISLRRKVRDLLATPFGLKMLPTVYGFHIRVGDNCILCDSEYCFKQSSCL